MVGAPKPIVSLDRLKARLKVRRESLNEELQEHAELLWHAGQGQAWAEYELGESKDTLSAIENELDALAREKFRGEKTTEKMILAWVQSQEEWQEANQLVAEAAYQEGEWRAMLKAYCDRGHHVSTLAKLMMVQLGAEANKTV